MSNAITELYHYVQCSDKQHDPQRNIQYAFEYSEKHKGFRAQVTVFGRVFAGCHYHARKQTAKQEASAVALEQLYNVSANWKRSLPSADQIKGQPQVAKSAAVNRSPTSLDMCGGVPLATRVVQWLEQTYRERQYSLHKPQTALLNELVQILRIEPPKYEINQVYHNIGLRTHAPFACTLFIDGFIFKSPEPAETVQAAKDSCASQAIYSLVQSVVGNSDKEKQSRSLNAVTEKQANGRIDYDSSNRKYGARPIVVSGYDKQESAILNEVVAKCGWNNPTYEYEESKNYRNAPIYRCTLTLHQAESRTERICGTEWCVSKAQAKHHAASIALERLTDAGICYVVRDT